MTFLNLFLTFFKIGILTFGGGYAMIPLIQSEIISRGWATSAQLIDFIAVSESTPGPFAINISTFIGAQTAGVFGAVCATLGVVLPSFIVILVVARFYERFKKSRIVSGVMNGLRPAVVGLIAAALLSVAKTVFFSEGFSTEMFKTPEIYISAAIFVIMAVLVFKKVHPILVILMSAAIGIGAGFLLGM